MNNQVLFVEPRGVQANVFSRYLHLPLLGPVQLGTKLSHEGLDVRIYNENLLKRDIKLSELDTDVLCLTALTSTVERAYDIARMFKAKNPRGRVIMGGIHASFMPEEALSFADHVVVGEGERIISDLIKYGSDEKIIRADGPIDLEESPIPDFTLMVGYKKIRITPIMTSRGCPFGCNFCTVTKMFGRRYRTIPIERMIEEVSRSLTNRIFFYDDNFVASKNRTDRFCDAMLTAGIKRKWSAQVRTDITRDSELVEKMAAAGCTWVYVGFESIDDEALAAYKKSQTKADIERAINVFHKAGISIHGMFMFGSDHDTTDVFDSTVSFCQQMNIDSVQYLILSPFPGTETYQQMETEGRLVHKMWPYYDGMHVVFRPANMSITELQYGMYEAFNDFYSITRLLNDSFNAGFSFFIKIFYSLFLFYRRQHFGRRVHLFIYLVARRIVKQWARINSDYLRYLKTVREPGEQESTQTASS